MEEIAKGKLYALSIHVKGFPIIKTGIKMRRVERKQNGLTEGVRLAKQTEGNVFIGPLPG